VYPSPYVHHAGGPQPLPSLQASVAFSLVALVGSSWQPVTAIVSHEGDGLRLL
jgi:hypothetical protein